jgi:hypothetical protein
MKGPWLRSLQVQIGNEINALPAGWRVEFHPATGFAYRATAFSMMTSSLGTSS